MRKFTLNQPPHSTRTVGIEDIVLSNKESNHLNSAATLSDTLQQVERHNSAAFFSEQDTDYRRLPLEREHHFLIFGEPCAARSQTLEFEPPETICYLSFLDVPASTLEIHSELELWWIKYLDQLPENSSNLFDNDFVELLRNIRSRLHNFLNMPIEPPDVYEGEDGGLQLVWDRGDLLLSVDVIDKNNIEWFLKNRKSGGYWGAEGLGVAEFPPSELQSKLISQNFK